MTRHSTQFSATSSLNRNAPASGQHQPQQQQQRNSESNRTQCLPRNETKRSATRSIHIKFINTINRATAKNTKRKIWKRRGKMCKHKTTTKMNNGKTCDWNREQANEAARRATAIEHIVKYCKWNTKHRLHPQSWTDREFTTTTQKKKKKRNENKICSGGGGHHRSHWRPNCNISNYIFHSTRSELAGANKYGVISERARIMGSIILLQITSHEVPTLLIIMHIVFSH